MLTTLQKAGWGLADVGVVVFNIVKQLLVFAFLTTALGVPVGLAGVITTGVLIFDMVTDPLIGWLSDRTQSRFGRRAPWMVAGAPIMAAALVWLFAAEPGPGAIVQVVLAFGVASIGFTMVGVPYSAMAGEMTQDPHERSKMTAWRMGFACIGILLAGALVPILASDMGEARAMAMISPLIVGSIWATVWLTRNAPRIDQPSSLSWVKQCRLVCANRAFVAFVLIYAVMTLAVAVMMAGVAFVGMYLVRVDGPVAGAVQGLDILGVLLAGFTLGALGSQVLWIWLSKRWGKLAVLMAGTMLNILLLVSMWAALPAGLSLCVAIFVVGGALNGGVYLQIPWAIYPDLMDQTRDDTGESLEGAHSALWLFAQKLTNALGPMVLGLILHWAGWQETTQGKVDQTETAVETLRAAVTLGPAAIWAVSLVALWVVYRPLTQRG